MCEPAQVTSYRDYICTRLIWAAESDAKVSQRTVTEQTGNMENTLPLKGSAAPNIDA